jgi:maleate isomerase
VSGEGFGEVFEIPIRDPKSRELREKTDIRGRQSHDHVERSLRADGILPFVLQEIVEELLEKTGASRVTIRLDTPGQVFPVVAEALEEGTRSIAGDVSIDLRGAATFTFLERERRNLIQEDCASGEVPAPPELVVSYGVKAQMLAPLVLDDRLVGILSVHFTPATRVWTSEDVAALDSAAARVTSELQSGQ